MDIIISQEQARVPVTVFHPIGRINMGNIDELTQKAQESFDSGMRDLILDLTEIPSMTSAGLRGISTIFKMLHTGSPAEAKQAASPQSTGEKRLSPHMKLLNPVPDVRKVLNISGFDTFIEIYDHKQEALRAF